MYHRLVNVKKGGGAKPTKDISTFTGHRISKTTKTLKHFMILLVTPETQHKSWVLILLGSNINIIIVLNSIVCYKAEPQDVGLYGHKLELFDMCQ